MTGLSLKGKEPDRFKVMFVDEGDEPLHPLGSYGVVAIYDDSIRLLCCRSNQTDAEAIADLLSAGMRATKPDHTKTKSRKDRLRKLFGKGAK